ncbi:MAG: YdcH family protein [Hyphomicrobiaceae bacterium]
MSLSAHLAELNERHKSLERRIAEEAARPGSDDIEIRRMKQEKLKLKEEIARLQVPETRH